MFVAADYSPIAILIYFYESFFWLLVCACQKGFSINAFNTMPATISLWVATESTSTC